MANLFNFIRFDDGIKSIFIIFLIGTCIRLIPELAASPYPIGYDVINYYLPLTETKNHVFSMNDIQIYPLLLQLINTTTKIGSYNTIVFLSSISYGILSVSIYLLSLKLNSKYAWYMTIIIIFQVALLRTTWDLHKDILALSFTFFTFYLLYIKKQNIGHIILIFFLITVTIFTDVMVSFLLTSSLMIYYLYKKNTINLLFLIILIISIVMVSLSVDDYNPLINNIKKIIYGNITENDQYSQLNLIILFLKVNIFLLPTFFIGLRYVRLKILQISLILVLIGSFSWIILPKSQLLLPDRWIILSGIFISIFSSFGLIKIILSSTKTIQIKDRLFFLVLIFYISIGILYMVLPNDQPFSIFSLGREFTGQFIPVTMQFNSIDIEDNEDLVMTVDWLNQMTQPESIIYTDKHLSGWMKILLKDNRTFEVHDQRFLKSGLYLIFSEQIDKINQPFKILKSQGAFTIVKK